MDYGRAKNYLQRELAEQEDIKALVELLGTVEGLEAEVKAREAQIAELKEQHEYVSADVEAINEGVKAAQKRSDESLAKLREQYEFDAKQAEEAYRARIASLELEYAEVQSLLDADKAKVAGYDALRADYIEKTALVAELEQQIAAKIAKLSA